MAKALKIKRCSQCYNTDIKRVKRDYKTVCKITNRIIQDKKAIPDWCPLEDWSE